VVLFRRKKSQKLRTEKTVTLSIIQKKVYLCNKSEWLLSETEDVVEKGIAIEEGM
jgi:hypothetical protein